VYAQDHFTILRLSHPLILIIFPRFLSLSSFCKSHRIYRLLNAQTPWYQGPRLRAPPSSARSQRCILHTVLDAHLVIPVYYLFIDCTIGGVHRDRTGEEEEWDGKTTIRKLSLPQCMKQWSLDVGYRMEVTHEGCVGDVLAAIVTGLGSGLIMTRTAKDQKCLP